MKASIIAIAVILGSAAVCLNFPSARAADEAVKKPPANRLTYNDGKADGRKSLGGSGEIISFTLPVEGQLVSGVRIHGSRYGAATPPNEDFDIYFLDAASGEIVATETAKYSKFNRGPEKWVEIKFADPVTVPQVFKVVLNFRAEKTKGVYVSFDTSTDGSHSQIGLPGKPARPAQISGDWMIEVVLSN